MPLLPILLKVASNLVGDQMSTTDGRNTVLRLINSAASELYHSQDLVGSLREQVFNADLTDNWQITLPYYVRTIRGVRQPGKLMTQVESMVPRYTTEDWAAHSLRWRQKYITPLEHSLDAATKLNFQLSGAETFDLSIFVTGSTPQAERVTETVVILAGATTGSTVNNFIDFPGVKVIRKSGYTNNNLIASNDAGVEVAFIPNCELEGRNTIIQVVNTSCGCAQTTCQGGTGCMCWEILYKLHFMPFVLDYDEFPCEGYDDAIYWKTCELWWAQQEGKSEAALLANAKCTAIVEQIAADAKKGQIMRFDFGKNKYNNLHWWDRRMLAPISMTQGIYPIMPGYGPGFGGGGCGY